MKIQCDVCGKHEASIFCSADDAALCGGCDHRVHLANKLASKHNRFSLVSSGVPMCDICQEKKAMLFCQQDRAILCKGCDLAIHSANELTRKHNRFLLTGIKLSAISDLPSSTTPATASAAPAATPVTTPSATKAATPAATKAATAAPSKVIDFGGFDLVPDFKSQQPKQAKKLVCVSSQASTPCFNTKPPAINHTTNNGDNSQFIFGTGGGGVGGGGGYTGSISEYLMEMLPGWQVDDFLDSATTAPAFGLSKGTDDDLASFWDAELEKNRAGSSEKIGVWVPQAPAIPQQAPFSSSHGGLVGNGGEKIGTWRKVCARKWTDDGFTVPQISPHQQVGSKRSRAFW
ncbi:B-box zinc finger protein 21-like protein [Drosera capensis]